MTAVAQQPQALIAGQWTSDTSGGEMVSINPADGTEIARIPACGAADVDRAVIAAVEVHRRGIWADRSPRERAAVLLRLADLMDRDAELLASLDSQQAGKPITECRDNDMPGAIESIRWFAEAADKIYTDVSATGHRISASPCANRSAWSRPFCRGTTRWRWPPGRSDRPWPPAIVYCSNPRTPRHCPRCT
jgi:acyl-CoA reductase-like NAD-dependent aldehyde dehydrogenase